MKRCAIALCLLLSAAGGREEGVPNPDPYLPLIEQGFLHEVVWQALEGVGLVIPESPAEALAVTPPTSTATVPAGVGPLAVPIGTAPGTVPPAVGAVQPAKASGAEAGSTVPGAPLAVGAQPDVLAVEPNAAGPTKVAGVPSAAPVKNPGEEVGSVRPVVPAAGGNGCGSMAVKPAGGAADIVRVPGVAPSSGAEAPLLPLAGGASDIGLASPKSVAPVVLAGSDAALLAKLRYATGDDAGSTLISMQVDDLLRLLDALPMNGIGVDLAGDALVERLLSLDNQVLTRANTLSYNTVMHLAGALSRNGDARCVPLYDTLLALDDPQYDTKRLHVVSHLANYYRSLPDLPMAVQTWTRARGLVDSLSIQSDYALESGRDARAMGDPASAEAHFRQAYGEAIRSGNGWIAGLALCELSSLMRAAGNISEARHVLALPIRGSLASEIHPAVLLRQAQLDAETGRLASAVATLRQAVSEFRASSHPRDENMMDLESLAEALLDQLAPFLEAPFRTTCSSVVLNPPAQPQASFDIIFYDTTAQFSTTIEGIQLDVSRLSSDAAGSHWVTYRILMDAQATNIERRTGWVTARLAKDNSMWNVVELHTRTGPTLVAEPDQVFLTWMDGQPSAMIRVAGLAAGTPHITTDQAWLTAEVVANSSSSSDTGVRITAQLPSAPGPPGLTGQVTLEDEAQHVVVVPCYVWAGALSAGDYP